MRGTRSFPAAALHLYKCALSPLLHAATGVGGACRFQPTCSEYAAIAVAAHGSLRGTWLAITRILRCHPFSRGGFAPVPGTWPAAQPGSADATPSRNEAALHLP